MSTKKIASFIILIAAMAAVSGCQKKIAGVAKQSEDKPAVVGQNENQAEVATTTTIGTATTTIGTATTSDPIFASTTAEIDTSDWQTYRNEEFGFEVKYPEGWKIDNKRSTKNSIVFNVDVPSRESIEWSINNQKIDYETYKNQKIEKYKDVMGKLTEFRIDSEKAFLISTSEFGVKRIFFIYKNTLFEITTGSRMLQNGMLDNFKFIR